VLDQIHFCTLWKGLTSIIADPPRTTKSPCRNSQLYILIKRRGKLYAPGVVFSLLVRGKHSLAKLNGRLLSFSFTVELTGSDDDLRLV
jgi:hypothetical protein